MRDLVPELIASHEDWMENWLQLAAEADELTYLVGGAKEMLIYLSESFMRHSNAIEDLRGRKILVTESLADECEASRLIVESLRDMVELV